jgi:hypothetical protein
MMSPPQLANPLSTGGVRCPSAGSLEACIQARRPSVPARLITTRGGDIYGHTSDATSRAAIDGLTNALGLS